MKLNRFVVMAALACWSWAPWASSPSVPSRSRRRPLQPRARFPPLRTMRRMLRAQGPDTDTQDVQEGPQNGPDTGTDAEAEGSSDGQDAAPLGTPAITADVAQATAEKYLNAGTASQVELDDENGQLVYSVEINGTDVKVDAMTGSVLGAESGAD